MGKEYELWKEYDRRLQAKLGGDPTHDTLECPICGSAKEGSTGRTIKVKCFTCWALAVQRAGGLQQVAKRGGRK